MSQYNSYRIEFYNVSDITFNKDKLQKYLDSEKANQFIGKAAALNGFKKYIENVGKWDNVSDPLYIDRATVCDGGSVTETVVPRRGSTTKPFNVAVLFRIGFPSNSTARLPYCNVETIEVYDKHIEIPKCFKVLEFAIDKNKIPLRVNYAEVGSNYK